MGPYFLAVDFGASGGRHIIAEHRDERVVLQEVYRFENRPVRRGGLLCWDLDYLTKQLITGMKRCSELGLIPVSMGIDTWGLDFVLLDEAGAGISPAVSHRDPRTADIYRNIFERVPEEELYGRTGIQMAEFNTLCQLEAMKQSCPDVLSRAGAMAMLPDYLNYLLTGRLCQEYSNASVTQLVKAGEAQWDAELIKRLGYPERIFLPIHRPGGVLGRLKEEIAQEAGFSCDVVLTPGHDTASAFLSLPPAKTEALPAISSGTWSLMGLETEAPLITEQGRALGFTNEAGGGERTLFLKNSMGLWMIQNIRREAAPGDSFEMLCKKAEAARIDSLVDCQSRAFLAPSSMSRAVRDDCRRAGEQVPETAGELARVVYRSLAVSYGTILKEMQELTGREFRALQIIGGGSNADFLNRLTAKETGLPVCAGPAEATALGNAVVQMTAMGVFSSLDEGRRCAAKSGRKRVFEPDDSGIL